MRNKVKIVFLVGLISFGILFSSNSFASIFDDIRKLVTDTFSFKIDFDLGDMKAFWPQEYEKDIKKIFDTLNKPQYQLIERRISMWSLIHDRTFDQLCSAYQEYMSQYPTEILEVMRRDYSELRRLNIHKYPEDLKLLLLEKSASLYFDDLMTSKSSSEIENYLRRRYRVRDGIVEKTKKQAMSDAAASIRFFNEKGLKDPKFMHDLLNGIEYIPWNLIKKALSLSGKKRGQALDILTNLRIEKIGERGVNSDPIMLVPGYGCPRFVLIRVLDYLESLGFNYVYITPQYRFLGNFEDNLKLLRETIQKTSQRKNLKDAVKNGFVSGKFMLAGHSRGGLYVAYEFFLPENWGKYSRGLTIAAPLHPAGINVAPLAFGPNKQLMMGFSGTLNDLYEYMRAYEAGTTNVTAADFGAIGIKDDVIIPAESATFWGGKKIRSIVITSASNEARVLGHIGSGARIESLEQVGEFFLNGRFVYQENTTSGMPIKFNFNRFITELEYVDRNSSEFKDWLKEMVEKGVRIELVDPSDPRLKGSEARTIVGEKLLVTILIPNKEKIPRADILHESKHADDALKDPNRFYLDSLNEKHGNDPMAKFRYLEKEYKARLAELKGNIGNANAKHAIIIAMIGYLEEMKKIREEIIRQDMRKLDPSKIKDLRLEGIDERLAQETAVKIKNKQNSKGSTIGAEESLIVEGMSLSEIKQEIIRLNRIRPKRTERFLSGKRVVGNNLKQGANELLDSAVNVGINTTQGAATFFSAKLVADLTWATIDWDYLEAREAFNSLTRLESFISYGLFSVGAGVTHAALQTEFAKKSLLNRSASVKAAVTHTLPLLVGSLLQDYIFFLNYHEYTPMLSDENLSATEKANILVRITDDFFRTNGIKVSATTAGFVVAGATVGEIINHINKVRILKNAATITAPNFIAAVATLIAVEVVDRGVDAYLQRRNREINEYSIRAVLDSFERVIIKNNVQNEKAIEVGLKNIAEVFHEYRNGVVKRDLIETLLKYNLERKDVLENFEDNLEGFGTILEFKHQACSKKKIRLDSAGERLVGRLGVRFDDCGPRYENPAIDKINQQMAQIPFDEFIQNNSGIRKLYDSIKNVKLEQLAPYFAGKEEYKNLPAQIQNNPNMFDELKKEMLVYLDNKLRELPRENLLHFLVFFNKRIELLTGLSKSTENKIERLNNIYSNAVKREEMKVYDFGFKEYDSNYQERALEDLLSGNLYNDVGRCYLQQEAYLRLKGLMSDNEVLKKKVWEEMTRLSNMRKMEFDSLSYKPDLSSPESPNLRGWY